MFLKLSTSVAKKIAKCSLVQDSSNETTWVKLLMFDVQYPLVQSQFWGVRVRILKDELDRVCSMFEKIMFQSVQ